MEVYVMNNHHPSVESRIRGCLWGLATGNVLGLAVESCPREEARRVLGAAGPLRSLPTAEVDRPWDDDLAMAMELAAWLESGDARSGALMKRYVRWFRENGRGAGSLMSSVLALSVRGETQASRKVWDSCCRFDRPPQGNGALMRVAPVGFIGLEDPGKARELAQLDAALTHWDPICTEASAFLALLVSAHLREEPDARGWAKAAMESRLSAELSDAIEPRPLAGLEERGLDGWDMGHVLLTLQTAVSVLESGLGFEAGLLWTLRQGGDADTNGAVVGALLGARDGAGAIPAGWIRLVGEGDRIDAMARAFAARAARVS